MILINLNGIDLQYECPNMVFGWKGLGSKFFWKNPSLSLSICIYMSVYINDKVYIRCLYKELSIEAALNLNKEDMCG